MAKGIVTTETQHRSKIRDLILNGNSDLEVEQLTGACLSLIQKIRTNLGIFKTNTRPDIIQAVFLILTTDKTYVDIAKEIGRANSWVSDIASEMREQGFQFKARTRGRPKMLSVKYMACQELLMGYTDLTDGGAAIIAASEM